MWHCFGVRIRDWLAAAGLSTLGVALIAVGFIGIFLPIIPGVIPIAAGMTLLARRFQWADRAVTSVKHHLPSTRANDERASTTIGDGAAPIPPANDLDAPTAA